MMELHPLEYASASPSSVWTPPATDVRDSRAAIGTAIELGQAIRQVGSALALGPPRLS